MKKMSLCQYFTKLALMNPLYFFNMYFDPNSSSKRTPISIAQEPLLLSPLVSLGPTLSFSPLLSAFLLHFLRFLNHSLSPSFTLCLSLCLSVCLSLSLSPQKSLVFFSWISYKTNTNCKSFIEFIMSYSW